MRRKCYHKVRHFTNAIGLFQIAGAFALQPRSFYQNSKRLSIEGAPAIVMDKEDTLVESKTICCEVSNKVTAEETKLYVVNNIGKAEKLITENGAEKSPFISGIKHSIGYVLLTFAGIALLVCDIVLFGKKKQKCSVNVKL